MNSPYPLFGLYLYWLVVLNMRLSNPDLDYGSPTERAAEYLIKMIGISYKQRTIVRSWFAGDVVARAPGKRSHTSLSVRNLKKIITAFAGKPGLQGWDELRFWLSLGPKHFSEKIRNDPEIRALFKIKSVRIGEEASSVLPDTHIMRTEILQKILQCYYEMRISHTMPPVLGIVGAPGAGKTTLCELFARFPIATTGDERIVYGYDTEEENVGNFLWHLGQRAGAHPTEDEHTTETVTRHLKELHEAHPVIYIFHNGIRHASHLDALLSTLTPECFVVFTSITDSNMTAHVSACIEVPPLNEDEALELASKILKRPLKSDGKGKDEAPPLSSEEKQIILGIADRMMNSPLGISSALRLTYNKDYTLPKILDSCKIIPENKDMDIQKRFLHVFALHYEALEPILQESFAMIGAMKHFRMLTDSSLAALWQVSDEVAARQRAYEIQARTWLLEPVGENAWRMHEQVWAYTQILYHDLPADVRKSAEKWMERERKSPSMQNLKAEAGRKFSTWDTLRHQIHFLKYHAPSNILRRLWTFLRTGYYPGPEWDALREIPRALSSTEYALAVFAAKREKQWLTPLVTVGMYSHVIIAEHGLNRFGLPVFKTTIGRRLTKGYIIVAAILFFWTIVKFPEMVHNEKIWIYLWGHGVGEFFTDT